MQVLFLSTSPLRMDNSIGNTYANIFDGMETVKFSSIFCQSGTPNAMFVDRCFRITEKDLLKNLKDKNYNVGKEVKKEQASLLHPPKKAYRFMKMLRFKAFFWGRDFIWKVGRWKSQALLDFVKEVQPDIIFAPLDNNRTLNNMIQYVHGIAGCKLVTYAWDDVYTLHQTSMSPLFWIDRFYQRPPIRRIAKLSDKIYVISKQQKEVYDKCFNKECSILFKGYDFKVNPEINSNSPLKMVFTGNLGYMRWKSIISIIEVLEKINFDGTKIELEIYSKTALKKSIIARMNKPGTAYFKGGVSNAEVMRIQEEADILLHIESFEKKQKNLVRLSFSTKLVDYFHQAKCIFAVGPKDVASMDYLIQNDAAITATNEKEIAEKLKNLVENPSMVREYGDKAWECGKRNHQIDSIQDMLYRDFEKLIAENNKA